MLNWPADHPLLIWLPVLVAFGGVSWWRWPWIKDNAAAASALAALIALIVTSVLTSRQLWLTRLSLESNLVYQMQKDTRTAGLDYAAGRATEADVFAVMQSVFVQRQIGSITADVWPIFQLDFCGVMRNEHLRRAWRSVSKSYFTPEFRAYMNRMTPANAPDCTGGSE